MRRTKRARWKTLPQPRMETSRACNNKWSRSPSVPSRPHRRPRPRRRHQTTINRQPTTPMPQDLEPAFAAPPSDITSVADAIADELGRVLADQRREWDRERDLAIATLKLQVMEFVETRLRDVKD